MGVMSRGAFADLFLQDMLPAIHHLVLEAFGQKEDKRQFMFNMTSSGSSIEQSTTMGTFPLAPQKVEGQSVSFFEAKQGFDKTYEMLTFAAGMNATEEMIEDDKFAIIAKLARALGKSIFETQQVRSANIFNNGFATAGPDGVSLLNAAHPKLGGGTESNTAAVDLTTTSFEDALIRLADTRDDEDKHIALAPKVLLVPPALRVEAKKLLESNLESGNANNDINAFNGDGFKIVVWDYLTDNGAWFVGVEPSDADLWYYERRAPRILGDFDFDTGNGKTKMDTRFDVGFGDWRGWYGAT